jgi:hypothetical protein
VIKKSILRLTVVAIIMVTSCQNKSEQIKDVGTPAIYNVDDRKEYYESSSQPLLQRAADSTLVMIEKSNLTGWSQDQSASTKVRINAPIFGRQYNLCRDERFYDQPSVGKCSSFLVGADLIATAGHCLVTQADCNNNVFVTDYMYKSGKSDLSTVDSSQIYTCKMLTARAVTTKGADFALVRLDRPVPDRTPLTLNTSGQTPLGTEVALIGYPTGLPLKIAANGRVRYSVLSDSFVTDLDAFGGNSGSAVVNKNTGVVEGILVRGSKDFTLKDGCYESHYCEGLNCTGEDVTKASAFAAQLNSTQNIFSNSSANSNSSSNSSSNTNSNTSSILPSLRQAGNFNSLLQTVNARLRNCRISILGDLISSLGKENTGPEGSTTVPLQFEIKSTETGKSEIKTIDVSTKSWSSAIMSLIRPLSRSATTQCLLQ